MFPHDESSPAPADKKTYAQGRLPDRTYIHKSFTFPRENSKDYGQPARFVVKVLDTESESRIEKVLASPDILKELYHHAPEKFRSLIENDVTADDVYALASRRKAVEKFSQMLTDDEYFDSLIATEGSGKPEGVWQLFFEKNPWILGVAAASQLLTSLDPEKLEQVVRGQDLAGPGKRVDALMRTAGKVRSVVLIELKTHRTHLLANREYRSGCWAPSGDMVGGVTQSQCNVHWAIKQLEERFQSVDDDGCEIPGDYSYLIKPRSLLIIGKLNELQSASGGDNRDKIRSFELFRRSTLEPEIVTFDELYAKALFIVDNESDDISRPVIAI